MEISHSLSIEFWLAGQETYNESTPYGVNKKLFYQPNKSSEQIPLQFTDTVQRIYKLKIFDRHDTLLTTLDFNVEEVDGVFVYSLSFALLTHAISNKIVWFQISYFEYSYSIAGVVTGLLPEVAGTAEFLPPGLIFEIAGAVTGLLPEVAGSAEIIAEIGISNGSLDVSITDVWVDGVAATLDSGSLPVGSGSGANMSTKLTGLSRAVQVFYTSTIPDQHITVTDSDGNIFCQSSNSGSPLIFPGCIIRPEAPVSIEAADGNCPP